MKTQAPLRDFEIAAPTTIPAIVPMQIQSANALAAVPIATPEPTPTAAQIANVLRFIPAASDTNRIASPAYPAPSVGRFALIHPEIPADITCTLAYPKPFARRAALGAFLHMGFEQ